MPTPTTSRLSAEVQRLYRLPDDAAAHSEAELRLVGEGGWVRTLVLGLSRPADWVALSAVWRGVQADLELPAPAIAVNGVDAYELWFSLAEPVPIADAASFLQSLCQRYLCTVKPQRLLRRPWPDAAEGSAASQVTPLIPAEQGNTGNWSAFVAQDLAAVFGDEPVLDLQPGADAQAELLSRLTSIKPDAFQAALTTLQPAAPNTIPGSGVGSSAGSMVGGGGGGGGGVERGSGRESGRGTAAAAKPPHSVNPQSTALSGRYEDPRLFLLDVMNDASVPLAQRIEAAKGLIQR